MQAGFSTPYRGRRNNRSFLYFVICVIVLAIVGAIWAYDVAKKVDEPQPLTPDEQVVQNVFWDGLGILVQNPINMTDPANRLAEDTAAFGLIVESVNRVNAAEAMELFYQITEVPMD